MDKMLETRTWMKLNSGQLRVTDFVSNCTVYNSAVSALMLSRRLKRVFLCVEYYQINVHI